MVPFLKNLFNGYIKILKEKDIHTPKHILIIYLTYYMQRNI